MRDYLYKRAVFRSEYIPRGMISKPIEVADRDRARSAEEGSRALLAALHSYFERGGRG